MTSNKIAEVERVCWNGPLTCMCWSAVEFRLGSEIDEKRAGDEIRL
jgi:hypothetical protein